MRAQRYRWLYENGRLSVEMAENAQDMENINLALALRATPQRQYVTQVAARLAERTEPRSVN
ncbi:hypothetical protein B1H58_09525 [Pantoea alhagi]|uniref:Uncharacterized protein n=1 Tax=Pantoea alhagi TaxID=1891675 RepID=A0A1W6B563_9GAMM|nr:hypothetical protein B1H58_09525 [Pantoea alhagi]